MSNDNIELREHQPTHISINEEILRAASQSLEMGIEYATEVLTEHDSRFGRTRTRHLRESVAIKADINRMDACLKAIRLVLPVRKDGGENG